MPYRFVSPARFAPAIAFVMLNAASAVAQTSSGSSPGGDDTDALSLERPVKEFLEAFIDADQPPEEQALFFQEGAQYYGFGPTGRDEIVRDIKRYSRHWPWRSYRLARIDYIRPEPQTDNVFVSYVIDYEVANRDKTAHGQARYGAMITGVHSTPQITLIMERVGKADR